MILIIEMVRLCIQMIRHTHAMVVVPADHYIDIMKYVEITYINPINTQKT